jgi:hypothetical protein
VTRKVWTLPATELRLRPQKVLRAQPVEIRPTL